jgi:hypothetical protein
VPEDIAPADGGTGRGELRASDADRDRVLSQLQDALAAGMIDMDEFSDLSGQAPQARTRRELATITSDLPASDTSAPAPAQDVVELRGTASPIKRAGRWIVPRKLVGTPADRAPAPRDHRHGPARIRRNPRPETVPQKAFIIPNGPCVTPRARRRPTDSRPLGRPPLPRDTSVPLTSN